MKHSLELKVELYKRGNYDLLNLFDKQKEALVKLNDDVTNETLYGGAARGGKSWLGCLWKIMNRLSMDGSQGLISRDDMGKLKDTTQKTFWKVTEYLGLEEGEDYEFEAGKQSVNFANGSVEIFRELKFLPIKDPEFDRIGSYDLTDVFIDEAQQVNWKAIDVLKGRYSELEGMSKIIKDGEEIEEAWKTIPKGFYSCNPKKNWIYTDFYSPHKKGELEERKAFITALPTDNPHISESYIENLKTANKVTKERLLYGNFDYDDDPSSLCTWEEIEDIFNNDHIEPDPKDKYLIADLAMMGRDRFIVMYWEGMVAYVDIVKAKSTAKEIEDDLKESKREKGVPNRRIIADSDGLGSFLSSYLENIQEFHGGSSPHDKRFGNLKDECGFKLAELIKASEIRIICEKEHEEDIKNELSICLKKRENEDDEKKRLMKKSDMKDKLGSSPDFFDCLFMRMLPEVEIEYDIFP